MKLIEFKFDKKNPFFREVMRTLLAEKLTDCIDIEEEIDKWLDEFNRSIDENFDIIAFGRYNCWIDEYFSKKGCDKDGVGECVKEFFRAFGSCADDLYNNFWENECFNYKYLNIYDYRSFNEKCKYIYNKLVSYGWKNEMEEIHIINALKLFDEKFNWIAKYAFHSSYKIKFAYLIEAVARRFFHAARADSANESIQLYIKAINCFREKYLLFSAPPQVKVLIEK